MRPFQSIRALANNVMDQGIRQAFSRQDATIEDLHAAVTKLGKGEQPKATVIIVGRGAVPATLGGIRGSEVVKFRRTESTSQTASVTVNLLGDGALPRGEYMVMYYLKVDSGTMTFSWTLDWNDGADAHSDTLVSGASAANPDVYSGTRIISSNGNSPLTTTTAVAGGPVTYHFIYNIIGV